MHVKAYYCWCCALWQIANDIGASRQTVEHYMRFRDQMEVAADGRNRLRLIET